MRISSLESSHAGVDAVVPDAANRTHQRLGCGLAAHAPAHRQRTVDSGVMTSSATVQWPRLFELADQPALPLQARLRLAVVHAILDGHLGSGAPLPSSRELATLLRISRNTVTAAYVQLIDEGFLQARPRSGVFVAVGARPQGAVVAEPIAGASGPGRPPEWQTRVRRSL